MSRDQTMAGDEANDDGPRVRRRAVLRSVGAAATVTALASGSARAAGPNVRVGSWCESLELRNRSKSETVEVTVSGPGGYADTVVLGPRGRRAVQRLAPGEYTLEARTASGGEATINDQSGPQTFDVSDCTGTAVPDLSTEAECRELSFENGVAGNAEAHPRGARLHLQGDNGYETLLDVPHIGEAEIAGVRDGTYTATAVADDGSEATINGQETWTVEFPAPCEEVEPFTPAVEATTDCGGVLRLENLTDGAAEITVDGPNGYRTARSVAAGETASISGLTEWYEYVVTARDAAGNELFVNGMPSYAARIPNCPGSPTPNVRASSPACESLSLTNEDADQAVEVDVSGPDGYQNAVVLDPGAEQTLSDLAGGDYTLAAQTTDGGEATVNGNDRATVAVAACSDGGGGGGETAPDVAASSPECETLALENTSGTVAVDVSVDGPSGSFELRLDPGQERRLHNLEAGDYTVTASTASGGDATVNGNDRATVAVEGCGPLGLL